MLVIGPLYGPDQQGDTTRWRHQWSDAIAVKTSVKFKNPNTYGITIEQSEEGTIVMPACVIKNGVASKCANVENMTIPAESDDEWMIATWQRPGHGRPPANGEGNHQVREPDVAHRAARDLRDDARGIHAAAVVDAARDRLVHAPARTAEQAGHGGVIAGHVPEQDDMDESEPHHRGNIAGIYQNYRVIFRNKCPAWT